MGGNEGETRSKQLKALVDELISKKAPNLSEFGGK